VSLLSSDQIERSKQFIFEHGRLLERKLFECIFEGGSRAACVRALRAYQNDDGGFGNGLEADLLCPASSAIGAETAMYVLEMSGAQCGEMIEQLARWVIASQRADGTIRHPPKGLFGYPHQPWWRNPDDDRVLVIAAWMKKWGLLHERFFQKVRQYYLSTVLPEPDSFYGYPHFAYLSTCAETDLDRNRLATMIEHLPVLLAAHEDHHPLFSRYWFYATDYVEQEVLADQARRMAGSSRPTRTCPGGGRYSRWTG